MRRLILILGGIVLWPLALSMAQLRAPNEAGVAMGQWHTIVKDLDETTKFWIAMGGTPIKVDGTDVIKFPGVLVFMTRGLPSGGSVGTITDHVGLGVPNIEQAWVRWKAAGVKKMTEIRKSPLNGQALGDVYTPDELMIEITEEAGVPPYPRLPANVLVESNHIHFHLPDASRKQMQDWYVKVFGAKPGELGNNLTGDIPGVRFLRWAKSDSSPLPTKSRALDYIGFEVKNLGAFCKKLEASGVKLDEPYSRTRHKSFASAKLTDPWGTSIELTEGLNRF